MTKGQDEFADGEQLPESFEPSKDDVIVGWARQNYHHEGNQMLRNVVRENVPRYMAAKTKHDKGVIIVEILEMIRAKSPSGYGLIRQNTETKRWYYIGTDKAKDKIGHALRKASRDFQRGVKGSPIKQQRRGSNASFAQKDANKLFPVPPRTPSQSSMAIKSFQNGPPASIAPKGLESWPLRSVTSLSSSESQSEEVQQQHHHHHGANQVTVPSSPVTRPGSSASNYPPIEAAERYARDFFDEKHHAWPTPQGHHYHGHYYHSSHRHHHPYYHGHEGYSHHPHHHYHHGEQAPDLSLSHHGYGQGHVQHGRHEYQEIAAPLATTSSGEGNFHRIFDEVEVPQHPHNHHHEEHYSYHQQSHPTATAAYHHPEQYPRSVSHEGPLIN